VSPGITLVNVVVPGDTAGPVVVPGDTAGPVVVPGDTAGSVVVPDSEDSGDDSDDNVDYDTQQSLIADLCLTPDIDEELDYGNEFDTADPNIDEEEEHSEEECANSPPMDEKDSCSFLKTDNLSTKIASFPKLKETIETNFCCKLCMLE